MQICKSNIQLHVFTFSMFYDEKSLNEKINSFTYQKSIALQRSLSISTILQQMYLSGYVLSFATIYHRF